RQTMRTTLLPYTTLFRSMSKNFELLHTISNEKELFETLEGWEDLPKTAAEGAGPSPQADAKERGSTPLETGLPDVFQTVRQTLRSEEHTSELQSPDHLVC